MIRMKVKDFLKGKLIDMDYSSHHVYIYRDGDFVFYVGKSEDIMARLWEHIGPVRGCSYYGRFGKCGDDVGRLIEVNAPDSLFWEIELLTIEDCRAYLNEVPSGGFYDTKLAIVEKLLIEKFSPYLNGTFNANARSLTSKYRPLFDIEEFKKIHATVFDED